MNSRRILLMHDDPAVNNLFQIKLEGIGFEVWPSLGLKDARRTMGGDYPDLILTAPTSRSGDVPAWITELRGSEAGAALPICVFPTPLPRINAAIQRAGATQVLQRQPKPVAHVLDACCRIFSLPPIPDPDSDSYDPDPEWLEHASLLSAESLNQMTRTLPALLVEEQDPHELHQLLAGIHAFADRTQFLNTPAVYQTSIALAQLIDDLVDMPEQMNASILRTIGQAVDFMGRLARDSGSVSVRPPTECSILIVDDEETARQFIQAAMQTVGVHSHLSGHPHDALKFLESNQVDSIFLDIGMPDMSGFDLCTQIRNLPNHKATPVIFITGLTTFQNRVQSSLSGGNDFIGKPFNLAELGLKALISVVRGQIDASTS